MAEYIEREALQNLFNEVSTSLLSRGEIAKDVEHMVRAFLMVTEMIQDAPAADVVPVRHGKWMPFHAEFAGDIQYCSVCEIGFSDRTAYCPHCGAVMDEWRKEAAENE